MELLPEQLARIKIDKQLNEAGWEIVSREEYIPNHAQAVKEALMSGTTESDYLLFIDNKAVAVIEAKRDENNLSDDVAIQAEDYAKNPKNWYGLWFDDIIPLVYLANGKKILFKNLLEPDTDYAKLDKIDEKQIRLATIQEKMEAKILKLAIQGKLVEQRSEEGTGEELFKLIQQEQQQLIKDGKIKKEKTLPTIEDDEIPFEIPPSWKWCKFGQLISLTSSVDLEPKDYFSESNGSSIPYITGASCVDEKGNLVINRFTDKSHVNSTIGDILLTCKGTIGKITVNDKGNMHLARQLMGIKTLIDFDFTRYYLMFIVDELKTKANGLIPGIDRPTVLNYYLPLPPLEEQKRIVAKIEELLPLCRGN